MEPTTAIPDLEALGVALAIDVVAVAVLALGIYFRQRGRRDLLMASVCANVALFAVVTVLGLVGSSAGSRSDSASSARCRSSACAASR